MQTIELHLRTYFRIGFGKVEVFKQHTDPRIPIIQILLEYYAIVKTYSWSLHNSEVVFRDKVHNDTLIYVIHKIACCVVNILHSIYSRKKYPNQFYLEFIEFEFDRFDLYIPDVEGVGYVFFNRDIQTINSFRPFVDDYLIEFVNNINHPAHNLYSHRDLWKGPIPQINFFRDQELPPQILPDTYDDTSDESDSEYSAYTEDVIDDDNVSNDSFERDPVAHPSDDEEEDEFFDD